MSAQHDVEPTATRTVLDRHFDRDELTAILGTDDGSVHSLVRRATWAPLADLLSRPGKGVRARLVEHAFTISGGEQFPTHLAQLVELLHAGSLIVDDVEDGAKSRRGAPTVHETFGVPVAINAGNFLYFLPIVLLEHMAVDEATALAMHRRIARCLLRCHHGQGLDLAVRASELAPEDVRAVVDTTTALKTGALMELSCALGALAAHASPDVEAALCAFGREAGVGLQMLDDLSGFLSPARRHKGIEDLLEGRPTWAWVFVQERTDTNTFRGFQRAARHLERNARRADALATAMKPLVEGAREVCLARIATAVAQLRRAVPNANLEPLVRDLRALEHGYV